MNKVTSMDNEGEITFGNVWVFNLRIAFPDEDILLAFIDISSRFR